MSILKARLCGFVPAVCGYQRLCWSGIASDGNALFADRLALRVKRMDMLLSMVMVNFCINVEWMIIGAWRWPSFQ